MKSPPKPRMVMLEALPVEIGAPPVPETAPRSTVMPGIRSRAAPRLVSGKLPMLSAEMASTTPMDSFLICSDRSRDPRIPVTTISCSVAALGAAAALWSGPVAACASRPAPFAGSAPVEAIGWAGCPRARALGCFAWAVLLSPVPPAAGSFCAFCACARLPAASVSEPNARLEKPNLEQVVRPKCRSRSFFLDDSRLDALRAVFRLIRHLPLERNSTLHENNN